MGPLVLRRGGTFSPAACTPSGDSPVCVWGSHLLWSSSWAALVPCTGTTHFPDLRSGPVQTETPAWPCNEDTSRGKMERLRIIGTGTQNPAAACSASPRRRPVHPASPRDKVRSSDSVLETLNWERLVQAWARVFLTGSM